MFNWLPFHSWGYRNPYSRKCRKCGMRQDLYQVTNGLTVGTKWCVMYPLVSEPCN